ncbi:M56 family metallopeptidase [Bacteroides nordii]|jgi:TonB family protein|uniref:M56 family metallopeptidase n=1 Tax=Bacteroides nordii TaxID=291645 RepID=UPI0018A075F5|nr:M56 family metallopeptidase [Bacteroides nordii]MBD9109876.1 TonB family protein [Bacteroides nordii]MCE8465273.1 TonB family protein [Bacteroides nordii]MCG4769205.1 M56 family metallopeptidase [Bacteroides nordii]UYU50937.1 M56 family metallopeptidase [Bacteroides nordii]
MTPELAYFLKINVGIIVFYIFYRLFFYKDTFFHWRRTALLCFLGVSLFYPMLNLQEWVKAHEPMVVIADLYATTLLPEVVFEETITPTHTNWQEFATNSLSIIYFCGVILLFIRFIMQLTSIILLRIQCKVTEIQGVRVQILNKASGPFSFFHWIFVHPESHTQEELAEILTHEQTHAHQLHSADIMFSELICIACWFNPFIWLMKREIRNNLEYMADQRVLQTGYDYKVYQYHLLGLAHHKAAATLYNSFNVLPLKNRIKMMNKKRTKEIGRTKYLLFLPLAALLLIISNIEAVARTTKNFTREVIQTVEKSTEQVTKAVGQIPEQATVEEATIPKEIPADIDITDKDPSAIMQKVNTGDDDDIFDVVEEMPVFPGGQTGLMEFIAKNLRYPVKAQKEGIQGRVIARFIVEKDGSVSNLAVARRSASSELDAEAIRVLSTMPKWTPGKQRGKEVRVKYTVPIAFKLSGPEVEEIKDSKLMEVVVVGYAPKDDVITPEVVLESAEIMPKYPGGASGLMSYLARNIKYPFDAQQSKTQGRVVIQMIVNKDGHVINPKVIQSVSPSLDAEAIRVVMGMPRWEPGKNDGQTVAVQYTLPITFKLQQ